MRLKREIENKSHDGIFRSFPFFRDDGTLAWQGKFRTAEEVSILQRMIGDDGVWCRAPLIKLNFLTFSDDNYQILDEKNQLQ